jgi:hypothetical protein
MLRVDCPAAPHPIGEVANVFVPSRDVIGLVTQEVVMMSGFVPSHPIAGVSVHCMKGAQEPEADAETLAAVARLSETLPRYAPRLHATLRPPVDEADLAGLRQVVAPSMLPLALVTLLRWADGQRDQDSSGWIDWWPALDCGPLLSATAIIRHYEGILRTAEDWQ